MDKFYFFSKKKSEAKEVHMTLNKERWWFSGCYCFQIFSNQRLGFGENFV